jgi:hypothetical protein
LRHKILPANPARHGAFLVSEKYSFAKRSTFKIIVNADQQDATILAFLFIPNQL